MRIFWSVLRYRDERLQQHPHIDARNVFYLQEDSSRRGENLVPLFSSLLAAESYAMILAQTYPTETIIVMEQKTIFELPLLPTPIKKRFNTNGELIPDAS